MFLWWWAISILNFPSFFKLKSLCLRTLVMKISVASETKSKLLMAPITNPPPRPKTQRQPKHGITLMTASQAFTCFISPYLRLIHHCLRWRQPGLLPLAAWSSVSAERRMKLLYDFLLVIHSPWVKFPKSNKAKALLWDFLLVIVVSLTFTQHSLQAVSIVPTKPCTQFCALCSFLSA